MNTISRDLKERRSSPTGDENLGDLVDDVLEELDRLSKAIELVFE